MRVKPSFQFILIVVILGLMAGILAIQNLVSPGLTPRHNTDIKSATAGKIIFYDIYEIMDGTSGQSWGDYDHLVDAGEQVKMRIRLSNTGDQDCTNVNATISTSDTSVSVHSATQDFVTIVAGHPGPSNSYYILEFNSSIPASTKIAFNVTIIANEGSWLSNFTVPIVGRPNPVFYSYAVTSEMEGSLPKDNDMIIDPGEVISLDITIRNTGGGILFSALGNISESDPFATIQDDYGTFGTIGAAGGKGKANFRIAISGACPDKHGITISMIVTDNDKTHYTLVFQVIVNGSADYQLLAVDILRYDEYRLYAEGDSDYVMDAGDHFYAAININNTGTARGNDIWVYLTCSDPYVTLHSYSERNRSIGVLEMSSNLTHSGAFWSFFIHDDTPAEHVITFSINITDKTNMSWTFTFDAKVFEGRIFDNVTTAAIIICVIAGFFGILILWHYIGGIKAALTRSRTRSQRKHAEALHPRRNGHVPSWPETTKDLIDVLDKQFADWNSNEKSKQDKN